MARGQRRQHGAGVNRGAVCSHVGCAGRAVCSGVAGGEACDAHAAVPCVPAAPASLTHHIFLHERHVHTCLCMSHGCCGHMLHIIWPGAHTGVCATVPPCHSASDTGRKGPLVLALEVARAGLALLCRCGALHASGISSVVPHSMLTPARTTLHVVWCVCGSSTHPPMCFVARFVLTRGGYRVGG